ncbi:glycosyltransferase [Actomonas aquatica]|uniref:Glycosyltransferase n=1 Tax=Actomonas aquatica TaxID=2866162 RepID=A0ABZ1CAC6_9BACT|nr:glycosyltransferase [Opitutus sp. WL0086]WRQ88458.1 glycosyltransferase [Opitutus sp. WL0086]
MKIALAHLCYAEHGADWYSAIANRAPAPLKVVPLPLVLPGLEGRISWQELDERWRFRDRELLSLYRHVREIAEGVDVLWNYSGAMLHPEFVSTLPCTTVFTCFDDPEDYPDLVAPAADAFDLGLHGNLASGSLFRRHFPVTAWQPIFTAPAPDLTNAARDIGLFFAGGLSGYSDYRRMRLERLSTEFPDAICVGRGWDRGYVTTAEIEGFYQRARMGWNVHRTIGPVNQRLFDLARQGVAQVCDSLPYVGQAFEIGTEILAFSQIEDGIRQIRQLLAEPERAMRMAAAARLRYDRDYTTERLWERFAEFVGRHAPTARPAPKPNKLPVPTVLPYRWRRRIERINASLTSALSAARATWRAKPTYQSWKFDESACLPVSAVSATPNAQHDEPANLDVPESVQAAWISILPLGSDIKVVGRVLPELSRLLPAARGATRLEPDTPRVIVATGPLSPLWSASRASSHQIISWATYGHPATIVREFNSLMGDCKAHDPTTPHRIIRAYVQPKPDVPWLEVLGDSHLSASFWMILTATSVDLAPPA